MCIIGAFGPDVFEHEQGRSVLRINKANTDKSIWIGNLVNLVPENQLIWVTCNIERPGSINASYPFDYTQKLVVTVIGTDDELESSFESQAGDLIVDNKVAMRKVGGALVSRSDKRGANTLMPSLPGDIRREQHVQR